MTELVYHSFGELLTVVVATVGSGIFTVVGLLTEYAAINNVLMGHSALGLWEVWMGGLALFVGIYLLGYQTVWNQLQEMVQSST